MLQIPRHFAPDLWQLATIRAQIANLTLRFAGASDFARAQRTCHAGR
jgi:hypothetical protein